MEYLRDCTSGIDKCIIYFMNFIILIAAVAVVAIGAVGITHNTGQDPMSVDALAIASGVLMLLIAFVGCYGAIRKSSWMLTAYARILLVGSIMEVFLAILVLVALKDSDDHLYLENSKHLEALYKNYQTNQKDTDEIDGLHRYLKCCGRFGPSDPAVIIGTNIVSSCCEEDISPCTATEAFSKGCTAALTKFLKSSMQIFGIIGIVFALIELVAAIFAFRLRNSM